MDQLPMTPQSAFAAAGAVSAERITAFLRKVYGWMCVGLGLTAAGRLAVASSPALAQAVFGNRILFVGLTIVELGLVFYLSARVQKLSAGMASGLFLLYSALNGVTISFIFLAYTRDLDRDDVRRDGRHVRRARALRHHDQAQPGRRRSVRLHGIDRRPPGLGRRACSGSPTGCSSSSRSLA